MKEVQNKSELKPKKDDNDEKYLKLSFNINTEFRGKGLSKEDSFDLIRFILIRYVAPISIFILSIAGFLFLILKYI